MIKYTYFGCKIVILLIKEDSELRQIYEALILLKLGFSKNFSRTALCTRRSALKIGLMTPQTIIEILKLKLYIGNKRKKGNVYKVVKVQEDITSVKVGQNFTMGEVLSRKY